MKYRTSLEKYDGADSRHICPKCGKKEFVRFIDNKTGKYIGRDVGRCNRENKCGYFKSSKNMNKYKTISKRHTRIVKKKPSYIHPDELRSSMLSSWDNDFVIGLTRTFCLDKVDTLIKQFLIGSLSNNVIFWQVDNNGMIRTGKIMTYDPVTLKRQDHPSWIHKYYKLKKFGLDQCFFGLHQLRDTHRGSSICLVESEKTAILMAGYYPSAVWMASGGIQMLSKNRLKPLNDHNVFLFPDIGAEEVWKQKASENRNVRLVNWPDAMNVRKENNGKDLADFPHPDNKINNLICEILK